MQNFKVRMRIDFEGNDCCLFLSFKWDATLYHEWLEIFIQFSLNAIFIRGAYDKFPDLFVWAFTIVVDSWKFSILLLYILWDDWLIFIISGSNEQLQQQLEYTLLKPDCHSWWFSKMQSHTLEERYAIKFCFKLGKNATDCFLAILHESSISFWVAQIQGRQGVCEGWWEEW